MNYPCVPVLDVFGIYILEVDFLRPNLQTLLDTAKFFSVIPICFLNLLIFFFLNLNYTPYCKTSLLINHG